MATGFVHTFSRLRTSWGFVVILTLSIGGWIAWNLWSGFPFDPYSTNGEKFGLLNFLLSIEATLSMPILWMAMEKQSRLDREVALTTTNKLDDLLYSTRILLEQITEVAADVDDIVEEVVEDEITTQAVVRKAAAVTGDVTKIVEKVAEVGAALKEATEKK